MDNKIEYKLWGEYALFTDPVTKLGGEKCSYLVPTYEALKGITESIYWKPTLIWYIDKVRIIKQMQTQTKSAKPMRYNDSSTGDLAVYTYLHKVEYRVQAHFEWNYAREDLAQDRNENKHYKIAQRYLAKGGKRDIFLGARECLGYAEPCPFDEGEGIYDGVEELALGVMFHSFEYPLTPQDKKLKANLFNAVMKKGVIEFPKPLACSLKREVKDYAFNPVKVSAQRDEEVDY